MKAQSPLLKVPAIFLEQKNMTGGKRNYNKRIAIFGPFLSKRGYNKSACEGLAEKLESRNWTVIKASGRLGKIPRLSDMIVTAWKERDAYSMAAVEVYSGQAFLWAEAVCLILKLAKKPYVLTLHGGNLPEFSKKWPGRVRRLLNSATSVTTPSRYLYEKMKPFRDDMLQIPNPIHSPEYSFQFRQKIKPHLVWMRAFHEIYNPSLAPKVVHLLTNGGLDVHLTMIGPDKGDGSLQKTLGLVKKLNVMDRIDFPGGIPKEKVPEYLERHDIFINTTNFDNSPISVIEAMACGLCIVSTNVGGIPYLLQHEQDSLLVPPDDPKSMAAAVQRVMTEPGLAERLSRNARAKSQKFSWDFVLPMWEELLRSVVGS